MRLKIGIILLLVLFAAAFRESVKNITCKTQYGPCEEEDYKKVQGIIGENLLLVSSSKVKAEVLQNFKNEEVVVHKIIPNTLSLIIEKRRAYAAVAKDNLGGTFLISRDGKTLSFVESSALPQLALGPEYPTPIVGENVPDPVIRAARIVSLTSKIRQIKKATLANSQLTVDSEGTTIIFPEDGDPEVLVGALQLIVSRAKMESPAVPKEPVSIDLRFKNPVLKY